MKKILAICKKFDFKDKYMEAALGRIVKEGLMYQIIEDESGIHLVLDEEEPTRFLYLESLKDKDPRYEYHFEEVSPNNVFEAVSRYPKTHLEFIRSDRNPVEEFRSRFYSEIAEEKQAALGEEEEDEEVHEISDEDFLIAVYKDMAYFNPESAEGLIRSFEYSSMALDKIGKVPTEESGAIRLLIKELESYKETGDPVHLGSAQLMLYYVFNFLKED